MRNSEILGASILPLIDMRTPPKPPKPKLKQKPTQILLGALHYWILISY